MSAPQAIGASTSPKNGQWVQTERKVHEAWARFCIRKPTASAVLHHLISRMGPQNAVVIGQRTLAKMIGMHERTVHRAISDLAAENWIQVVRIGRGREAAYVINDRVAWGQTRDQLRFSLFSATVIADFDDQDEGLLGNGVLRRIPSIFPGEIQLPAGPGEDPPSQPFIDGMEPDLPALKALK